MKKIIASFLALVLVMSPIGSIVLNDQLTTVEAKRYKSGKKGFNSNQQQFNQPKVDKKKEDSASLNKSTETPGKKGGFTSGGLMKGLFFGGIAGLLFGGLLANMGVLGSIVGFAINVLAILLIVGLLRKIFFLLKERKRKEDMNPWQS